LGDTSATGLESFKGGGHCFKIRFKVDILATNLFKYVELAK